MTDQPIIDAAREVMTPEQVAQIEEWRSCTIGFVILWAGEYARSMGWPHETIAAHHYDILQRAGAVMDGLRRHEG